MRIHVTKIISSWKIFDVHGLKHHIMEIDGDVSHMPKIRATPNDGKFFNSFSPADLRNLEGLRVGRSCEEQLFKILYKLFFCFFGFGF